MFLILVFGVAIVAAADLPYDSHANAVFNQSCIQGENFTSLRLGLPDNSNALVTGYLPAPGFWICARNNQGLYWYHASNAHGVFTSYVDSAGRVEIGVSSGRVDPNAWSLYFSQRNSDSGGDYYFKICKWDKRNHLQMRPETPKYTSCLVDIKGSFNFRHRGREIIGVTWSGDMVRLYLLGRTMLFYLKNDWSYVSFLCALSSSCNSQVVRGLRTINVTTDASGQIMSYKFVSNNSEMAQHIFAVGEGGRIPADFSFKGWFVLTNSSTLIDGRVLSYQPLLVNCLWPIPGLLSTSKWIYFNGTSDASCNGFKTEGDFDTLRFALNFSANTERVLDGHSEILIKLDVAEVVFTCSNTTTYSAAYKSIPFGYAKVPYYCFAITNGTAVFVGMLPVVLREVVITKFGGIYLNGYRVFQTPPIRAVLFNVTNAGAGDFWTVAMTRHADVLLDVNGTAITNILYCDSPINMVKCQQMQFMLPDGFYPVSSAAVVNNATFVTLPRANTHQYLQLYVAYTVYNQAVSDPPYNYTVKFIQYNGTQIMNLTGQQCISTTQFTTNVTFNGPPDLPSWVGGDIHYKLSITSVDCPFELDSLNNGLTFQSLCFSLEPQAGACTLSINKVWSTFVVPFASLYVTYKSGDAILGVKQPRVGIYDISEIVLDVCCEYVIYGIAGRGVISKTNSTYLAGLYYTSPSGLLLGFKNATTGEIFSVKPCDLSKQVVVINDVLVGAMSSSQNDSYHFNNTISTASFYYHNNEQGNCTNPVLTYSQIGVCSDGSITNVTTRAVPAKPNSVIGVGNISIPTNFSISIQAEYVQLAITPVSVDCSTYVCNGNPHCLRLLAQYVTACKTIEDALQQNARLESSELYTMLDVSHDQLHLANVSTFGMYNLSSVVSGAAGKRTFIEDLLFDKVVTNGLGTVDNDYKSCTNGLDIADLACAQYYNGIMVLPGVADANKLSMYTASLLGGMALGGITAAAATPFALAVQSRLNYVALQTDVLQKNQQILANSFNAAIGNITVAFGQLSDSLQQTADAINTVASALNKVQSVVNSQGQALHQLTKQLSLNFQAISSSIEDIYRRLDGLAADAQVDRLINGRLAALNAFVTQTLTSYAEVRASRRLAQEKINECVSSQSRRYGFCGNGTHLFTIPNAAPNGIMLLHTVLVPTAYKSVAAYAGFCANDAAYVLKDPTLSLFKVNDAYRVSSRHMYEPRVPVIADFVRISHCDISYVNISSDNVQAVVPDYVDVNKTLEDFFQNHNASQGPNLPLDIFNQTYLNLSSEIALLENKSAQLELTAKQLEETIKLINSSLVDLQWLNRFEQYVKWPWYVWLLIVVALTILAGLMLYCCLATGCCGCCSCMTNTLDFRGRNLQRYEVEKVHVQ